MKIKSSLFAFAAIIALPIFAIAAPIIEVENVGWGTGGGGGSYDSTLSEPLTKNNTYYFQINFELSTTTGNTELQDNSNAGAFLLYLGDNYNDSNLFSAGFSTSASGWGGNKWVAFSNGTATYFLDGDDNQIVPKFNTAYQFNITLNLGDTAGNSTYDITLVEFDPNGNVILTSTLPDLPIREGNYFNNNHNNGFSKLMFQSSTGSMGVALDKIIISQDPQDLVIPEPSAILFIGIALGAALLRRRRR